MSDPLLPRTIGLGLASILLGRSPAKVRELVRAGSLETVPVGKRTEIPLDVIEQKRGQEVTPEMFCYAQRALDRSLGRD